MDAVTAVVAHEDPQIRAGLLRLLEREVGLEVVGHCEEGQQTLALIQQCAPELVLLNAKSKAIDGFGIVERFEGVVLPVFIFIADSAQYALRAFDAKAIDYLLNPLSEARFRRALGRARDHIHQQRLIEHSHGLLALLQNEQAIPKEGKGTPQTPPDGLTDRLVLKTGSRFLLIDLDEIDWIEADDVYVRLHTGSKSHLMRTRLKSLERRLDPARFVRIHRSTIVNLGRVREVAPHPNGGAVVGLRDGKKLKMSRSYLDRLTALLV